MQKILVDGGYPISPLPVTLVSCGSLENPLALAVSWTGIVNSVPLKVYISVQPIRNSIAAIRQSGEFVINIPNEALLKVTDACGCVSGRKVDKFREFGLTAAPCLHISAPMVAEYPVSIECRVCRSMELGSHEMFIADVLAVHAAPEAVVGGRLDYSKIMPPGYANRDYFAQGQAMGCLGFTKGKI